MRNNGEENKGRGESRRQAIREEGGRNVYKTIQNQAKSNFKLFQISVLMDSL